MRTKKNLKNKIAYLKKTIESIPRKKGTLLAFSKKTDLRGQLFSIEGILRLHLKTKTLSLKDQSRASEVLLKFKELEDLLGELDLNQTLGFKVHGEKGATEQGVREFIKNNWDFKQIKKVKKQLFIINWPKSSSKNLTKMLKQEIIRLEEKTLKLKPLILKSKYSVYELEQGFHEWRRAIRWVSIYLQAFNYKVYLQVNLNKKNSKLYQKYQESPFVNFPRSDKHRAVKVDKTQYLILSDFIQEVGEVKDLGEKNLYTTGVCQVESLAKEVYLRFLKSKVLQKILIN